MPHGYFLPFIQTSAHVGVVDSLGPNKLDRVDLPENLDERRLSQCTLPCSTLPT